MSQRSEPWPATWAVRKARVEDAGAIRELIAPFAARDLMLPRPLPLVYEHVRDFHVVTDAEGLLACVALHVFDGQLAEVKSLAVAPRAQGQGVASRLVRRCLDEALELGIARVFALVLRDDLWRRLGFATVDKDCLPQKVWGECIFCAKYHRCDEVAVVYDLA
jgi:amino-acid N-acetyltransferase